MGEFQCNDNGRRSLMLAAMAVRKQVTLCVVADTVVYFDSALLYVLAAPTQVPLKKSYLSRLSIGLKSIHILAALCQ